jgi:hypothetical protein
MEFGIVRIIDVPIMPGKNESTEPPVRAKSDLSTAEWTNSRSYAGSFASRGCVISHNKAKISSKVSAARPFPSIEKLYSDQL